MSVETIEAVPIVRIPNALVYEMKSDNVLKLVDQGELRILQFEAVNDCFILQVGDFNYSIVKDMPVLASSQEMGALRSYVLSKAEGYYIVRVTSVTDLRMIQDLEAFFSNNTKFAEKEPGEAKDLVVEKTVEVKTEETYTEIVAKIISKGGEVIRTGLVTGAEYIAVGVNKGGDYIKETYIKEVSEVDISDSTVQKIKYVSQATNWFLNFKKTKVEKLVSFGKNILTKASTRLDQVNPEEDPKKAEVYNTIKQIGKATIWGVANVYVGMMDALDIIEEKGIHVATTKIMTHKYGEKAGAATKEILGAVVNVSNMTKLHKIAGTEAARNMIAQKATL
jgi:hypothetical protein